MPEGQRLDLELGVLIMAFLKFVIWDLRAEVMDMMKTDVPRKPL